MAAIDEKDIIRFRASFRNPFRVEALPLLSRLHRFAHRRRGRGLAKRMVGKPAKYLYSLMMTAGIQGSGRVRIETPAGPRSATFNARNTQFSALYFVDHRPVYEAETSALLDRLIGDQDTFFDIGANWGWFSVLIATRPSFKGTIHAFEPYPPSFADLAKMVSDAGLKERIQCHDIALAESNGEATMSVPDGLHSGLAKLGGQGSGVKVRLAQLDSLGLPPPNVMKIDVEDHEMGVLQGAAGILANARPFIVIESGLNSGQPELTFGPMLHLIKAGYTLFYPAWVSVDPNLVAFAYGHFIPDASRDLALVPFLPIHRSQLGPLLNIVAVPSERMQEFRRRFQ